MENEYREKHVNPSKTLFGIDDELSLQSVNFAPAENRFLNQTEENNSNEEIK